MNFCWQSDVLKSTIRNTCFLWEENSFFIASVRFIFIITSKLFIVFRLFSAFSTHQADRRIFNSAF